MLSSETEKVCEAQIQLYLWGLFVLQGRAYIAFSIISSIQAVKKQQRNNKETANIIQCWNTQHTQLFGFYIKENGTNNSTTDKASSPVASFLI